MKDANNQKKQEMKDLRDEKKEYIKGKRKEQRENLKEYREENKGKIKEGIKELPDDVREELKTLKENFKTEYDALKGELKAAEENGDEAAVEELKEKLHDLRKTHYEAVQAALPEDSEATEALKERREVYKENREIRNEISDKRKEFREEKKELVGKYKQAFVSKLGSKLEKIPTDRLDAISQKIDGLIEKFSENTRLSDTKKEALLGQLEALKDIIDDRINATEEEEELDIEAILEIE
jgi:Zn-dependent oligopeptidase